MFRKVIAAALAGLLISPMTVAQSTQPAPQTNSAQTPDTQTPSAQGTTPTVKPAMQGFGLEDGTPVKLRTARTISSADAHTGDTLDFEVLEDVMVGKVVVIPKGGIAWGTVTDAQPKRRMGRGGKLDVNIDSVKLVDGEKVPLRAVKDTKGGSHTGAMTGAMVATAVVFFPAAPLFLFMHGKDITIPKGAEVTAYVNGDVKLDLAKLQQSAPATTQPVATAAGSTGEKSNSAKLEVESIPPGADIEIDGNFVGSAPSDLEVREGEHVVTVKKAGFKDWERKIQVSAGSSVHLSAELEKTATP